MQVKNLLLTGPPGIGKTSIIRTVAERLKDLSPAGFYTAEIREGGIRQGFELVSFSGETGILAHVRRDRGPFVGKYRVDVEGFEAFLGTLEDDSSAHPLYIIDEIGKMEWVSPHFRSLITTLLDGMVPLLATIALQGNASMEAIKRRPDVEMTLLSRENRNRVGYQIIERIREMIDQE